ncbi:MAG: reverse transcriptase (RNA-dependent DNA polymerase)-domain-containing protein, partial [Olpidium bornovanus]
CGTIVSIKNYIHLGLGALPAEPCVYILKGKKKHEIQVIVAVYVDDLLLTGPDDDEIIKIFERNLEEKIKTTDGGDLSFIIGIRVRRKEGLLTLDRKHYAEQVLTKFGMTGANPVSTRVESGLFATQDWAGCHQTRASTPGAVILYNGFAHILVLNAAKVRGNLQIDETAVHRGDKTAYIDNNGAMELGKKDAQDVKKIQTYRHTGITTCANASRTDPSSLMRTASAENPADTFTELLDRIQVRQIPRNARNSRYYLKPALHEKPPGVRNRKGNEGKLE